LRRFDYPECIHSELRGYGNNVLIASRTRIKKRDEFHPPAGDPHAPTNMLHVHHFESGIDVFGIRVAIYDTAAERRQVWDWLAEPVAASLRSRRSVIIGDMNVNPELQRRDRAFVERFRAVASGWQHAAPVDGASFWSKSEAGIVPTRLDHALVSPLLGVREARYVTRTASYALVEPSDPRNRQLALSDHAALIVDVAYPPPNPADTALGIVEGAASGAVYSGQE
jgi:endonuclease/exonuclease/phosphatase family metal-dependent hydrolase